MMMMVIAICRQAFELALATKFESNFAIDSIDVDKVKAARIAVAASGSP